MVQRWKTVRVFISSTFRDMQAERDHLVRFVFPRLREQLLKRRIHLVDVDLRWGVTGDQDAFELCMDEIDRCQPRFLCMLGGRYGWVPPAASGSAEPGRSITASEIHYAALDKLNEPAFRYFYFRDPDVTASIPDPYAADYREPEGSQAARDLGSIKARIQGARGRVQRAPGDIVEQPLPLLVYPCAWDTATARITRLEAFGARVYADLLSSIDAEFREDDAAAAADPLEEERAAMDAFVEERTERYVVGSREPVFRALAAHLDGRDGNGLLCVVGTPGSGKSALMGRFSRDCEARAATGGATLLTHFVGASAASTNMRLVLRRFCHELARAAGIADEIPDGYDKLRETFPKFLEQAAATRPVWILIDAVNQLDPAFDAREMRWLPDTLPPNARVVLSALAGPSLDALRRRHAPPLELVLDPISDTDATAIVGAFLARYRKTLDAAQRGALLAKTDARVPLYLLTALEELRTLGTYEEISQRISSLPERVQPLYTWILDRLEHDPGFRGADGALVGADIVRRYCSLLATGRAGMAESELVDLIAPGDPARGIRPDHLGNVAALQRLLRPYLMPRGELTDFFHGQLREAVAARYLSNSDQVRAAHCAVALYFRGKADPGGDASWTGLHPRAFAELPYHQTHAELWDDVYKTMTDLAFLEAKCTHVAVTTTGTGEDATTVYGGVYDLLEDYRLALERFPEDAAPDEQVGENG